MGLPQLELTDFHACSSFHANFFYAFNGQTVFTAVAVGEWLFGIVKDLLIDVLQIRGIICTDPTQVIVVTNIGKGKTKTSVTGKVPTLITMHMALIDLPGAEER